mgnify:CR=1 FL=1
MQGLRSQIPIRRGDSLRTAPPVVVDSLPRLPDPCWVRARARIGDLVRSEDGYRLSDRLLARQRRQDAEQVGTPRQAVNRPHSERCTNMCV